MPEQKKQKRSRQSRRLSVIAGILGFLAIAAVITATSNSAPLVQGIGWTVFALATPATGIVFMQAIQDGDLTRRQRVAAGFLGVLLSALLVVIAVIVVTWMMLSDVLGAHGWVGEAISTPAQRRDSLRPSRRQRRRDDRIRRNLAAPPK